MAAPGLVTELAAMLDQWRRPAAGSASPLRTCFRLTPPSPEEVAPVDLSLAPARGPAAPVRGKRTTTSASRAAATAREAPPPASWSLEFLLQPVSDPSLLVPASEVWRSGPALAILGPGGDDPREKLLADLGHASRLLPELGTRLWRRPAQARSPSARRGLPVPFRGRPRAGAGRLRRARAALGGGLGGHGSGCG